MTFSATSRRAVRTLAHRNVNWSAPIFKGNPELASYVNTFRSWVAESEAMAEKYSAPPAPIDFTAHKAQIRDQTLSSNLEALYKSATVPPEVYEWSQEDQAKRQEALEDAKNTVEQTLQDIKDTEEEILFLKANRTTRDTCVADLKAVYPDVAEEIDTEINNREWFKDVVGK